MYHHLKLSKAVKSKLRWLLSALDQHLNPDNTFNFMIRPFIEDEENLPSTIIKIGIKLIVNECNIKIDISDIIENMQ